MKLPTRRFLLRLIIILLSATAVLGIIGVLWAGLGETGTKILGSAIAADAASFLALCCTGRVTSAWQRAIQVTGILSACLGLVTGIYLIWWGVNADRLGGDVARATAVLFILAAASAHASLLLRLRSQGRLARTLVAGTVICTAAAAELIANYALIPNFDPGNGYGKALTVILILDVLGTIVILLLHRLGRPGTVPCRRPESRPGTRRPLLLTPSCRPFGKDHPPIPPPGSTPTSPDSRTRSGACTRRRAGTAACASSPTSSGNSEFSWRRCRNGCRVVRGVNGRASPAPALTKRR